MVGGYDGFNDKLAVDNHQSGSDFRVLGTSSIYRDGVVYPVWNNVGSSTLIQWNPISNPTQGSNFRTHSLFFNDVWRASPKLTLNLGLRYDLNDGTNSSGTKDVSDSKVSPRLGLTFDPKRRWRLGDERQLRHLRVGPGQRHRQRRNRTRDRRRPTSSSISGRRSTSTPTRRR